MSDGQEQRKPAPWELMDRGSPAGAALFRLYSGDSSGREAGKKFHQANKQVHAAKLQAGWTPPPVTDPRPLKVEKPQVAVPKPTGRRKGGNDALDDWGPMPYIPHKKPGEVIQMELREEQDRMMNAPMPPPQRPLLDDQEKERLATLMHFRGKPPEVTSEEMTAMAATRGRRTKAPPKVLSEAAQLEELFEEVVREVKEREEFLEHMKACGKLDRAAARKIQGEIQDRIKEMQKIDAKIGQMGGR